MELDQLQQKMPPLALELVNPFDNELNFSTWMEKMEGHISRKVCFLYITCTKN
jgi:hypothetical protein